MEAARHPLLQLNFDQHNQAYVIEASAGTGKTWTIERLFIKALLERSDLSLNNILVVTFTNAATAELKDRILLQIKATLDTLLKIKAGTSLGGAGEDIFTQSFLLTRPHKLDNDINVLLQSAQNFDYAPVYTIHGFCNHILKDYPVECNINPEFKLVTEHSEIMMILVRNFFREKIINNPLFRGKIEQVYQTLEHVLGKITDGDYIQKIVAKLPKDLITLTGNGLLLKYKVHENPDLALLIESDMESDKTLVAYHLFSAVAKYIELNFATFFTLRGELSYNDLISIVAAALPNNHNLAEKIRQDYPIAFIDEFQDTDQLQWNMFNLIYNKAGTLVVVGDPKQAIYKFRGADLNVYLSACNEIQTKLYLTENRRSHPNILNFINYLFDQTINPGCFGANIEYNPITAKVDTDKLLRIPSGQSLNQLVLQKTATDIPFYNEEVHLVVIKGKTALMRENNLLSAIALEILALLNIDSTLTTKIAILVSKNSQATILVEYLKQFGIKACELKLGNIFATQTAADLYLVLEAVSDLSNRRLLIQALSSKLFNLPLSALSNFDSNTILLATGVNIAQCFFRYKQIWEKEGVISLIYQLVNDLYALHKPDGYIGSARQISDLFQLGEILHKYDITTQNMLELLFWFQQKISSATKGGSDTALNLTNEEEIIRLDNDDNQVVITTQHKSKGLEYDILFCPYFKADAVVNGEYDFSYKMPFFASYYDSARQKNVMELINSVPTANKIVQEDNKEIHRLNYVALTRAKSRLYLYLKEPTINAKSGSYHAKAKPDKITELFGYVKHSPQDQSHLLFNYRQFFTNPDGAIKQSDNLAGVSVYARNTITTHCLEQLKIKSQEDVSKRPKLQQWTNKLPNQLTGFLRQSYSSLTYLAHTNQSQGITGEQVKEYSLTNEVPPLEKPVYIYEVLNHLKGAVFGNLIHNLCESYPLTTAIAKPLLQKYNVDSMYAEQLVSIVEQIFSYPLFTGKASKKSGAGVSLSGLHNIIFELEFNLAIANPLSFKHDLAKLLVKYYGDNHPYTTACSGLDKINPGFLNGFIDVFFEHGGKYYILDYKTNSLSVYMSTTDGLSDKNNVLVAENAKNHYYLQYLLYLVAIKRYLESRLNLANATDLLGGAVYFYVRGIFVRDAVPGGICIDASCQSVVAELDCLLKGEVI